MVIKVGYISISIHVLVWVVIFLLPILFKTPLDYNSGIDDHLIMYFGSINFFNAVLFYFNVYILSSKVLRRKGWPLYLLSLLGIGIIISILKLVVLKTW